MSTVQSRPYRWPYHGLLLPESTAILICYDESPPVGAPARERLRSVAAGARAAGVTIVQLPGRVSAAALDAEAGDIVCVRPALGGFTATDLDLSLRNAGIRDLLIAGFPLELGADCTMREANDLGYECLLVEDCCTALSEATRTGAVRSVQMSGGIFGAVACADDVIDAMRNLPTGVR